jgi:hypothetical protein
MTLRTFLAALQTPGSVALLLVASAGSWLIVDSSREHRLLTAELRSLRSEAVTPGPDDSGDTAAIEELKREIARTATLLDAAEAKVKSAQKEVPPMNGEELRSLGRMADFAREAATFIQQLEELTRLLHDKEAQKQNEDVMTRSMAQMTKWTSWIEVIAKMEEDPREIAELHALTIAERLQLDPASTARVREQIETEFSALARAKLVRANRPASSDELKQWLERRQTFLHAAAARVEEHIPAESRKPWIVEQSLQLGNALRQDVKVDASGHGSATIALVLPGIQF